MVGLSAQVANLQATSSSPTPGWDEVPADRERADHWSSPARDGWTAQDWQGWRSSAWFADTTSKAVKADYSDPPQWPGWPFYRAWRKATLRWSKHTDVHVARRADKILKLFDWTLASEFQHLSDELLASDKGVDRIVQILGSLSGEREGDELRRAVRSAVFEFSRRKDETLTQYTERRDQDFTVLEEQFNIRLPTEVKSILLEEGASLQPQGEQNLRSLTEGKLAYETVSRALKDLDTVRERMTSATTARGSYLLESLGDESTISTNNDDDDDDDRSITTEVEDELLQELDRMDLGETDALETYVTLVNTRRRTRSENKSLKQAIEVDRQHQTRLRAVHARSTSTSFGHHGRREG